MRRLLFIACALLLFPRTASASSSVGLDVTVGSVSWLDGVSTTNLGLNLSGSVEVKPELLTVDLGYTALKDDAGLRHLGLAGVEYTPTEHWNFELLGLFSPPRASTREEVFVLRDPAKPGKVALSRGTLAVSEANGGGMLAVGYDTFGESNFETAIEAEVGYTHFDIDQTGSLDVVEGQTVSKDFSDTLEQLRLSLSLTETFFLNTDVTLRGTFDAWDKAPDLVGYVSRAAQPVGLGLAVAPIRWESRLLGTHRFGRRFSLSAGLAGGQYSDGGLLRLMNARVVFRPIPSLRTFLFGTLQRDTDGDGDPLPSRYVGAGVEYRF